MALKDIRSKDVKRSRSFQDIDVSFARNPVTDGLSTVKNENAIKQAVKNLIMTSPGEKLFEPNLGSQVISLLFEPLDPFTAEVIREEIINTINQYEPRVELENVTVKPLPANNKFNVVITFRIVGLPAVQTISFVLKRTE